MGEEKAREIERMKHECFRKGDIVASLKHQLQEKEREVAPI